MGSNTWSTEAVAWRCFVKTMFLNIKQKSTGKHLCRSLFFNKVVKIRLAMILKNRFRHQCMYSTEFCENFINTNTNNIVIIPVDRILRIKFRHSVFILYQTITMDFCTSNFLYKTSSTHTSILKWEFPDVKYLLNEAY